MGCMDVIAFLEDEKKLYIIDGYQYGFVYWWWRGTHTVNILDWGEDNITTAAQTAALLAAFQQEVVVWHKLDHPNIPKNKTGHTGEERRFRMGWRFWAGEEEEEKKKREGQVWFGRVEAH